MGGSAGKASGGYTARADAVCFSGALAALGPGSPVTLPPVPSTKQWRHRCGWGSMSVVRASRPSSGIQQPLLSPRFLLLQLKLHPSQTRGHPRFTPPHLYPPKLSPSPRLRHRPEPSLVAILVQALAPSADKKNPHLNRQEPEPQRTRTSTTAQLTHPLPWTP